MQWCCSRYNFAVIIGCIYIAASLIYFLKSFYVFLFYYEKHVTDVERRKQLKSDAVKSAEICLAIVLISALFIVAVLHSYHYMIVPWLIFCVYGVYGTFKFFIWWFIGAGMSGGSLLTILLIFLMAIIIIGSEIAVFVFSCSLFNEIRDGNMENRNNL